MINQADWLTTNHMVGISHSHHREPKVADQRDTADSMRIMELEGQLRRLEQENRQLIQNQPKDQNISIQAKMIEELLLRNPSDKLTQRPITLQQPALVDVNLDQTFIQLVDHTSLRNIQHRF